VNQDDIAIMHALSVAAMGRPWNEVSVYASEAVVAAHLVDFNGMGTPFLTDDGTRVFREAVAAMKEFL
jgi:hypothetical protein